jgi:predicted Mrr-cat superfamily restriction endonuclease
MVYENVYGTSPYETGVEVEEYMVGDLVTFAGKLYTPDFIYVDSHETEKPLIGIVIGIKMYGSVLPKSIVYKVKWLNKNRISEVAAGHLRLMYARAPEE